jgi:hypothetical protein
MMWVKSDRKTQFIAARYRLSCITTHFLVRTINDIIRALWLFGFAVTGAISGDGASENRLAFFELSYLTVGEVLPWLEGEVHIPLDLLIGFYHPMDPDIVIFIVGDMPHIVKKIVKALEQREQSGDTTNMNTSLVYVAI